MASMRDIKRRKSSIQSTQQITKAMKLVSTVKLQKAKLHAEATDPYFNHMYQTVTSILAKSGNINHPYLTPGVSDKIAVVVITSNRGLAGGYNANVFRFMRDYPDAEVIPIGKRACDRYGKEAVSAERFSAEEAIAMANELCADFGAGKFDRLGIVCTKYISLLVREVEVKWILPFTAEKHVEASGMIFEPDELTVLNAIASEYVAGKIMAAVRESFACEIASRKTAMDSAGKNAQEMIDALQLEYNRARQSAITQEITEIVAGSGE